jgi:hypothetical protein
MPKVSVLMSVHNGADYLRAAVASVLAHEDVDFDLWVMDDGSTDNTGGILDGLSNHSRITTLSQPNRGLGASLNRLFHASDSLYVARMDADDVSFPWRLREQVRYLDQHPDVGVCSTWHLFVSSGGLPFYCDCYPDDSDLLKTILESGRNPIAHPTVMMRRDLLQRLEGPYRFRFVQDYDLWLRLLPITRFGVVQRISYALRVHSGQVSSAIERRHRLRALYLDLHRRRTAGEPEGSVIRQEQMILQEEFPLPADSPYQAYIEGMAALASGRLAEARRYLGTAEREEPELRKQARRWKRLAYVPGLYRLATWVARLKEPKMRYQMPLERAASTRDRQAIIRQLELAL